MANRQLTLDAFNVDLLQFLQDRRVRAAQRAAFMTTMPARMTLSQLERLQREPRQPRQPRQPTGGYKYPLNIKARTSNARDRNRNTTLTIADSAFNNSYQDFKLSFNDAGDWLMPRDRANEGSIDQQTGERSRFLEERRWMKDQIHYHQTRQSTKVRNMIRKRPYKMWLTAVLLVRSTKEEDRNEPSFPWIIDSGKATLINSMKDYKDLHTKLWSGEKTINEKGQEVQEGGIAGVFEAMYLSVIGITSINLHINTYTTIRGASWVDLPEDIKKKNRHSMTVLNVKNDDQKCFQWAVLSALHEAPHHRERVTWYKKHEGELDFTGLEFPISVDDIPKFEKKNPGLTISAYELNDEGTEDEPCVRPWRVSEEQGGDKQHIQLLLYQGHWMLITNWDHLCSSNENRGKTCPRCLTRFSQNFDIAKHIETCKGFACCQTRMPEEGSKCKFQGPKISQLMAPVCIHADFEALQPAIEGPDKKQQNTHKGAQHTPCSYGLQIEAPEQLKLKQREYWYTGPDAHIHFVKKLLQIEWEVRTAINSADAKVKMSREEKKQHEQATTCFLCGGELGNDKIIEHCHITGKYRGAAHQCCNNKVRKDTQANNIPVCLHNTKNYDTHFITEAVAEIVKERKEKKQSDLRISGVGEGSQKLKALSINNLRIVDTCAHMQSSLDGLLKNLPADQKTRLKTLCSNSKQFELVQKKLLLPYEKMTNWEWFEQPISYDKADYWSSLSQKGASDEDIENLRQVAQAFQLTTNRELHDLYLKVDVLGLADVFTAFRALSHRDYGLDPVYYMGTPGFGWDAMLKQTKVELDLITDPDMYQFCERGKRGGVSMAALRHAKANNPYLVPSLPEVKKSLEPEGEPSPKFATQIKQKRIEKHRYTKWCLKHGYNPKEPETYILYLDANNLYGYAMSEKMPHGNLRWGSADESPNPYRDWNGDTGAFVEVDLEYPEHLHDLHSELPMAPENVDITSSWLSKKQMELCKGKPTKDNHKLTPHFHTHHNYICHARNLKFYLEHGLRITKVHRVLYFDQSNWLEPWIRGNTERRAKAKNDFEKDFYKLMNNAVFGKTMEDVRGRQKLYFITQENTYRKHTGRPAYKQTMGFGNENFRIVTEEAPFVLLDKPIYAGVAILELSKVLMYWFHYDIMQPKFGAENLKLCMTDTDSLMYHITCKDLYARLGEIREHMDTSDYPEDHPLFSKTNKKVIGKFKDETNGTPIREAACLRAKCYWFDDGKSHVKCKGVSKPVAKQMTGEDYRAALAGQTKRVDIVSLRSYDHTIVTQTQNKVALSPYDDKRYMLDDCVHTRPHGHFRNVE